MADQQDITFCGSDCTNKSCRRHPDKVYPIDAVRSFADFSYTCPDYKPPENSEAK